MNEQQERRARWEKWVEEQAILQAYKSWLEQHLNKVPPQQKLGQAMHYSLHHWEALNRYLKDGRLEIDNNRIENVIRPFAVGRKNWLFSGSPRGAKAGATLYSLLETCKANGIEPYQYFVVMLQRIRLCSTEEDYRQLLPQFIRL
jgi:transposase